MHHCLFFIFFLDDALGSLGELFFFHLDFGSNVSTVKVMLHVTVHIFQKLAGPLTDTQFTFLITNCSEWGTEDGGGGRGQEDPWRRGTGMLGSVDSLFSAFLQWLAETAAPRCCIVLSDMSTARAHLTQNLHVRSFLCSLEGRVISAYLDVKLRTCYAKCVHVGRSALC